MTANPVDRPALTPVETLEGYIEHLEDRAKSAREAVSRAYEDVGRYQARLDDSLAAIARTREAIRALTEAAS